ncbi:hypothetical protein AB0395_29350 [Streptosporangium sp. NPDC051023]|uniref:hypothetical protein n=1 Tax=Streptosporangium sp. NPDC051023 TaxID=3155410 RepID=UPI00344F8D5B
MRIWPLALLLTACTACGVGPSRVIDAGEPARGFAEGTPLYFVRDDRLVFVSNLAGPLEAAEAVELLLEGPGPQERERDFVTRLPKNLAVQVNDDGFTLGKSAPMLVGGRWLPPVTRLSRMATGQLVCTIAAATATKRDVDMDDVRVAVPDKGQVRCKDFT